MRKANLVQTAIWDDPDFHDLPPDAKLVYLMLLTQAKVTAVGALDMAPKRWADSTGLTHTKLVRALIDLENSSFLWLDPAKEELVIRSWVKHNVEGSPMMTKAATNQYHAVASPLLRQRLGEAYPSLFPTLPDTLPNTPPNTPPETPFTQSVENTGVWDKGIKVLGTSGENDARARVWAAYQAHHPGAKLTRDRERLIDQRLRDFTADQLVAAIDGNHRDAYCNGENPNGKQYHALDLILRNADKIEQYANVPHHGNGAMSAAGRTLQLVHEALSEGVS